MRSFYYCLSVYPAGNVDRAVCSERSTSVFGPSSLGDQIFLHRGRTLRRSSPIARSREKRSNRLESIGDRQIQRVVKLQKLKGVLAPASGEEGVSNEAWAEAAGETVQSLREALEEGANAKQEMGERW